MREYFGFSEMAHPDDARQWFDGLLRRQPFEAAGVEYFRTLRLEVDTRGEPMGGGYWFGDRQLVMVRGSQDEAAVHELAHAWWERQRGAQRDALMNVLRELGNNPPAGFPRIAELANVYCHGIKTQRDDSSPTGYWRGMRGEGTRHRACPAPCRGALGGERLVAHPLRQPFRCVCE